VTTSPVYGLVAEFADEEDVLQAARAAYDAGYRSMDAYTPFPVEGLSEVLGFRRTRIPLIVLIGGIVGGLSGFALQYWVSVIAYPLNIGGRPNPSVPMFVPVTFELTILLAALFGVIGMLALNGLPQPYHPLFNVDRFSRASQDRFFLGIESADRRFDLVETRRFLEGLNPAGVYEVAP
jgi:hypothetical protein